MTGARWGFRVAVLAFLAWGVAGPYFDYGEAWKMTFFLGTTSVTFLTVLLARNAQSRSSKALHLKLDELIVTAGKANNELIETDDLVLAVLESVRATETVPVRPERDLEPLPAPAPAPSLDGPRLSTDAIGTLQSLAGRRWNPTLLRTAAGRELARYYETTAELSEQDTRRAAELVAEAGGRDWCHRRIDALQREAHHQLHCADPAPEPAEHLIALSHLLTHREY